MYVADSAAPSVYVFSGTGELVSEIGSKGQGPGEFRQISDMAVGNADSVFVLDVALLRVSVFTPVEYLLAETITLEGGTVTRPAGLYGVANEGMVFGYIAPYVASKTEGRAPDAKRFVDVVLVNRRGRVQSPPLARVPTRESIVTVLERGGISVMPLPFGREPMISVSRSEMLYSGWNDEVNIAVQSMDGSIQGTITRPHSAVPVTSTEMAAVLKGESRAIQRRIQDAPVPKTKPAYQAAVVDDKGRVWIQSSVKHGAATVSGVIMRADNTAVGTFELPANVRLHMVRGERAYGVLTDENGADLVVAYDIG